MEESYMNVLASSVIYENPLPQLRSRQSAFPFLCELPGGMLLASHAIGEAFESVDGTTCLSRSEDGGRTWSAPVPMFDKGGFGCPVTDYAKVTLLPDGTAEFTNTARGLTQTEVGRLFDRFYTVESGRGATGLGLSIARLLAERMGGEIGAEYGGERLTVRVRFPETGA